MTSAAWLIVVDTATPLGIALVLIVLNSRSRVGAKREIRFWGFALLYLGMIALFAIVGARSVDGTHGYGVLGALAFALPLALPGAILHQVAAWNLRLEMHPSITSIFAVCVICWALLNPLLLRLIVNSRRRSASGSAPSP
jgi:hypothetical protein